MIILSQANICMPSTPLPANMRNNPKFFPYFKDCIGAIDGSHYPACPPADAHDVYRNRKGDISINVLIACDFSGRFIYVLAGWEGSAHDWKVYEDAIRKDLVIPEGKYLLADAGFHNSHRLLVPFRGIRYHLQETARSGLRPRTAEELYNLRHSQFRINVEILLGRHKGCFRILTARPCFSVPIQVKVIYATAGLINWMMENGIEIPWRNESPVESLLGNNAIEEAASPMRFRARELRADEEGIQGQLRRKIANDMYHGYLRHLEDMEMEGTEGE